MAGALDGLRVIDLSQYLAGPLTALQLADLGADVIRVDRPGGPAWADPANAVLQRGKRSIVLDLTRGDDRDTAQRLIDSADVVVESWRPGVAERLGVGPADSLARNPRLVYCSIPGFGRDDPRASVAGHEGVVAAAAGLFPRRESGDTTAPRFTSLPMASNFAAMQASHAVMAALIGRERSGAGQHVEVALFDAAFELLGGGAQKIGDATPPPQGGPAPATMPQIGHYRCADSRWIQLCLVQPRHLDWFVRTFLPDRVADGWADAVQVRDDVKMQSAMRTELTALMSTRTALAWEQLINERSWAPTALCQTSEDWLRRDQHARDSGAVVAVDADPEFGATIQAGSPFGLSATPPLPGGPRHRLDADREQVLAELATRRDRPPAAAAPNRALPLAGTKVVDLSQVLAGPTSARILADYGADVVKINSPVDRQHFQHLYTNAGKQTVLVDLKQPAGMEVFRRLLADADVLVENFTRGVADRLGVGYEQVREQRPDIVYTSVSAFGHTGYRGGYRGREELGQAVTGIQMRWYGAESPRMVFYPLNDYAAGNWAAFATLVALYHRMRTGQGQQAHSSLSHAGTFHQVPFMVAFDGRVWDEPSGIEPLGWGPWDRLYPAADRWLYLAAHSERDRAAVRKITGIDETADEDALEEAFSGAPAAGWVGQLQAHGVGAAVVLDQEEAMEGEVARARGLSRTQRLPTGEAIRTVGSAARLSRTPLGPPRLPGPPGADAAVVLDRVGLADRMDEIVAIGAVLAELPPDAEFVGRFRPTAAASGAAALRSGPR